MQYRPFLRELKGLRGRLVEVINTVHCSLNDKDWGIVMHDSLDVLIEHGEVFRDYTLSKTEYFRETGSTSNALLTERENHFLRSAASWFRLHGRQDLHDSLLDILQVQISNPKIVQQLLKAGYLTKSASQHAALHMLWVLDWTGYGQQQNEVAEKT